MMKPIQRRKETKLLSLFMLLIFFSLAFVGLAFAQNTLPVVEKIFKHEPNHSAMNVEVNVQSSDAKLVTILQAVNDQYGDNIRMRDAQIKEHLAPQFMIRVGKKRRSDENVKRS